MWRITVTCVIACVSADSLLYYRLLVDSFKDSDGDGLGDLAGATKQLSYIRALGADAVILSPIQAKSTNCSQPGNLDFNQIDPRYGDEEAFTKLIEKSIKLKLKVLVSLDIQTVSSASEWFTSSSAKRPGYENWMLWRNGKDTTGETLDEDEEWVLDDTRQEYWASINNETVLNLCSEGVVEAFKAIQCAWIKRGVAGFVIKPDFKFYPECGVNLIKKLSSASTSCARSVNMDTPITLVDTEFEIGVAAKYYDAGTVISNTITGPVRTPDLAVSLHAVLVYCPQDMAPVWLTSSTKGNRVATTHGSELVDAINLISLVLPGSVIIQQGDELGVADTILEWANNRQCWPSDVSSSSAPFPWDESPTGGFTYGEPWLPLPPNYRYANAKTEFANDQSHVGVVRIAAAMRKSPAFGPYYEIKRINDALAILRWGSTGSLLLVCNLGKGTSEVQLTVIPGLPNEMTVAVSSGGSSLSTGAHVTTDKALRLNPGESVLLAGGPRHCGGPGPVDKIANKLSEGWQKLNKYFSNI